MDKRRIEFFRARDRYFSKSKMFTGDPNAKSWPSLIEKRGEGINHHVPGSQDQLRFGSSALNHPRTDARTPMGSEITKRKDANGGFDSQLPIEPGLVLARKKRVHAQVILYIL